MCKRFVLLLMALCVVQVRPYATANPDQFTPVVASALTANTIPFEGTDGRVHIVYELMLTNANATSAILRKIEVLDASNLSKTIATFEGHELQERLRSTNNSATESTTIELNNTRIFLVDFTLGPSTPLPARLVHGVEALAGPSPAHTPQTPAVLSYTAAALDISRKLAKIGPPLTGKGWLAVNGCCSSTGIHRATGQTVNGNLYFAQRFAIDWMRMDDAGQLVHGDPADVHDYPGYGAEVVAVAGGTVVNTMNDLADQTPGVLPDPRTITLANVDGNHVVLDLGDGIFAFYAHLQRGSVRVVRGDRVKRGQVLGKLGNTGNTSAPHLHFHLMEGSSVLGSNGIPYVIDSFALAGQVSPADFEKASGVEGKWSRGLFVSPTSEKERFPLNLDIVSFPLASRNDQPRFQTVDQSVTPER